MENEKDLKNELFEQTFVIEGVLYELEKAKTVLDHWTQEYSYCQAPDPMAAIAWGRSKGKNKHLGQSAQWFMEYEKIVQFINIVSDYVYASHEKLQAAIQREA